MDNFLMDNEQFAKAGCFSIIHYPLKNYPLILSHDTDKPRQHCRPFYALCTY